MIVMFQGHFVAEIPSEKFTVVLKKVKGEDCVPLFQTLTFEIVKAGAAEMKHFTQFFEMGEQIYDYASRTVVNTTLVMYGVLSLIGLVLAYLATKAFLNCRKEKQSQA